MTLLEPDHDGRKCLLRNLKCSTPARTPDMVVQCGARLSEAEIDQLIHAPSGIGVYRDGFDFRTSWLVSDTDTA